MIVEKIIKSTQAEKLDIVGATLLDMNEAKNLLTKGAREYNNWWWLRSPGYLSFYAAFVSSDGSVDSSGLNVLYGNSAVRPALIINNLKSSNFKIGDKFYFKDKEFKIISDDLAFCLGDIGRLAFRVDYQADDANDYEKSDVKQYVDNWFIGGINDK